MCESHVLYVHTIQLNCVDSGLLLWIFPPCTTWRQTEW